MRPKDCLYCWNSEKEKPRSPHDFQLDSREITCVKLETAIYLKETTDEEGNLKLTEGAMGLVCIEHW